MKIRDRLPFRQPHPDSSPTEAEPQDAQQARHAEGPPREQPAAGHPNGGLAGAFELVAQTVGDEIVALRDSLGGLEAKLMARLDVDRREASEAIETVRKDVLHRFEEMRNSQQRALGEIAEKTRSAVAGIRDLVDQTREQVKDRSDEVRRGLEHILAEKEQRLAHELGSLSSDLAGVRLDLQHQMQASGRISNLLDNVANVFTGQPEPPRSVRPGSEDAAS